MHRFTAWLVATLVAGALTFTGATPAHADVTCGDAESDWVGAVAGAYAGEYFDLGAPYDATALLTNVGNVAVTTNVDTTVAYNGYYFHTSGVNELTWYGTAEDESDRLTFIVAATSCDGERVSVAGGEVHRYGYGLTGVVLLTRV